MSTESTATSGAASSQPRESGNVQDNVQGNVHTTGVHEDEDRSMASRSSSNGINCELYGAEFEKHEKLRCEKRIRELKVEKSTSKAQFTKARKRLITFIDHASSEIEEFTYDDRKDLNEVVKRVDNTQEAAMKVMTSLTYEYLLNGSLEDFDKITVEMEKLEQEYSDVEKELEAFYKSMRHVRDSRGAENSKDSSARPTSRRSQISPVRTIQTTPEIANRTITIPQPGEIVLVGSASRPEDLRKGESSPPLQRKLNPDASVFPSPKRMPVPLQTSTPAHQPSPGIKEQIQPAPVSYPNNQHQSTYQNSFQFDPTRLLTRVSIPKFTGDKRNYQSWKAAFTSCVDDASTTAEYKLLRLRDSLTGEALKVIDGLGHSEAAYTVAKERLDRKYGGARRQIILRLEELDRFKQVRDGNARDLEKLAELLDIITVNLMDNNQESELGSGSLFISLQKKLSETLLSRYIRWAYDKGVENNVTTLREFVNQEATFQIDAAEAIHGVKDNFSTSTAGKRDSRRENGNGGRSFVTTQSESPYLQTARKRGCKLCPEDHGAWACDIFKQLTVDQRWDKAKSAGLCYRCLGGDGHRGEKCTRTRICGIDGCQQTHNRLLHRRPTSRAPEPNGSRVPESKFKEKDRHSIKSENNHATVAMTTNEEKISQVISLRTVPVIVKQGRKRFKINALLDDASTSSYVSSNVAAELGIQGKMSEITVNVLNGKTKTFTTMPVEFGLESLDRKVDMKIVAKTVNDVTGDLEVTDWSRSKYSHLQGISFPKLPKKLTVDLLIGSDYAELHHSMRDVIGQSGEPVARQTRLGWTCIGPIDIPSSQKREGTNFAHSFYAKEPHILQEISESLRQFWEIETVEKPDKNPLSAEDKEILQSTQASIKKEQGRYQVAIPWKGDITPEMPDSRVMAEKRLISTENKLLKDSKIAESYCQVIRQYLEKGYIRKIQPTEDQVDSSHKWYLPHFPVIRPEKSTTKTRIVFDASAKVNGVCLNDKINQGPKTQNELFAILLRFRKNPVAIVCDIAEMYLQISLEPKDRAYHRFLWRDLDQTRPADEFEFQRVVFGVNSSPFLAQFISQEHARKNKEIYPRAAEAILLSTYMDDSLDSVDNDDLGKQLGRDLPALWKGAGMYARKILSNSQTVLADIPEKDRASEVDLDEGYLPSVKTLGVLWQADEDVFAFRLTPPAADFKLTKRNLLRKVAAIFDPLGMMSPYVILGKIIMQEVWTSGVDWDEQLPEDIEKRAWEWISEITELSQAKVPRCLRLAMEVTSLELHTFGDASKDAYGAVVYSRSTYENGEVATRLVASKTKVAPLTQMSIPRLEMMAAILGLQLTLAVTTALNLKIKDVTLWSDSQNVLWWIRRPSRTLKPFIANRVGMIQQYTDPQQWRYVPTKENPADLPSRGVRAKELVESSLWWNGPAFLHEDPSKWPENIADEEKMVVTKETRKDACSYLTIDEKRNLTQVMDFEDSRLEPSRFSNWQRLKTLHGWVQRFIRNCRTSPAERKSGVLSFEELQDVELLLIGYSQRQAFAEEYTALQHGRELPKSSKIVSLSPRLDADLILRSDGRLKYAEHLSYDARHPIILPRNHPVTQLLVRFYHEEGNHVAGTNQVLSEMSAKYWIIRGREEIRDWESKCAACQKRKARVASQLMAPLPMTRVNPPLRAFAVTSVDYAGPFLTKQGRGKVQAKRYLCLFTCHASRALHLEMAYALDTNSFLNAFNRFTHRRGVPVQMTSDNGTNFVGANREMMELVTQLDQEKITKEATIRGIKWTFNPPLGPHFGGIHESLVKSAKKAIYAVLQKADITDEELTTAFTGAEALLNSRPLSYQSADSRDEPPITPNHFLHGQCGGQFAPEEMDSTDFNPRRRWRLVQELLKHFWSRWLKEWLPLLQQRQKWKDVKMNLKIGDIVLVADPGASRGNWPLGRVTEIFPGKDGHTRVVRVQVGEKTMIRPIVRLCPLQC